MKSVIELKWESGLVFVVLEEILFPLIAGIQPLARSFQPVAHSFLVPAGRRGRFE